MSGRGIRRPGLPRLRVVIGSLLAALAAGSVVGLVIGILSPPVQLAPEAAAVNSAEVTTPAGPTVTPSVTPTGTPTGSASATAGPSPSVSITTVLLQPAPVPNEVIADPAADPTLTLGLLQSIDAGDPNNIMITVAPAALLTGAKALAFAQQQGQQPRDPIVAPVNGAQPQQYTLEGDAALWGTFVIGDDQHANLHRFALQDFLTTVQGALAQNQQPAVWIKRSLDVTGPVIYLAEQYPA